VKQLPLTRIIVAHSATTIATAGRVVKMEAGRMVLDFPRNGSEKS